jgi:hypothetical protein
MTLVNTPLSPPSGSRRREKSSSRRLALAVGAAFLAGLILLSLGGRSPSVPVSSPDLGQVRPPSGGTLGEISRLQAAVRRAPAASAPRVALAG